MAKVRGTTALGRFQAITATRTVPVPRTIHVSFTVKYNLSPPSLRREASQITGTAWWPSGKEPGKFPIPATQSTPLTAGRQRDRSMSLASRRAHRDIPGAPVLPGATRHTPPSRTAQQQSYRGKDRRDEPYHDQLGASWTEGADLACSCQDRRSS